MREEEGDGRKTERRKENQIKVEGTRAEKRQKELNITARLGRMFSAIGFVRSINTMPAIMQSFENIVSISRSPNAFQSPQNRRLNDPARY